jgi:hypothetical protein
MKKNVALNAAVGRLDEAVSFRKVKPLDEATDL